MWGGAPFASLAQSKSDLRAAGARSAPAAVTCTRRKGWLRVSNEAE